MTLDCPKCDSGSTSFIRIIRVKTFNIFIYKCNNCGSVYKVKSTIRAGQIIKEYYYGE